MNSERETKMLISKFPNNNAGRKSYDLRAFYGFGEVGHSIDKFTDLLEWIDNGIFPIACDSFGN